MIGEVDWATSSCASSLQSTIVGRTCGADADGWITPAPPYLVGWHVAGLEISLSWEAPLTIFQVIGAPTTLSASLMPPTPTARVCSPARFRLQQIEFHREIART